MRVKNDYFELINGDCIEEMMKLESNSIDFSVFSPPFADLYVYSDDIRDLGNSDNYEQFEEHFEFVVEQLARIIKAGRLIAVHCADLPIQKGKEGYIGLRDFPGSLIKTFMKYDFIFHTRVTIWKDPVVEMQRTKALGLLHKQLKKDSSMSRVAIPDYLLIFRDRRVNGTPIKQNLPVDLWQKWASPIWQDINYTHTLQSIKGNKDEKHICPLQLDTIERAIQLYTNECEIVFSPFAGIGSEGYQSILLNRKFLGIELKEEYYNQAVKNLNSAIGITKIPKLFVS